MNIVRVDLGERSYNVLIGIGISIGEVLDKGNNVKVMIVSDTNVAPLYADAYTNALATSGYDVCRHTVNAGETSKTLANISAIYDAAILHEMDRGSIIIALGGGVVGDMAGFAAATFMRGISYVQVPTTLLAMVDSSVGGKTGVNVAQGKNLIGAFYQPQAVLADLDALDTLPESEYSCGLAEVVKYGAIWDRDLFSFLEEKALEILSRDKPILTEVVSRCCEIKAEVVHKDEKESGLRTILNYGHTLGHALEKVLGYGVLNHGEAVAIGMVYASRLSGHVFGLSTDSTERLKVLLRRLNLPSAIDSEIKLQWEDVRKAITVDKKTSRGIPRFVLSKSVGVVEFGCQVEEDLLKEVYTECVS